MIKLGQEKMQYTIESYNKEYTKVSLPNYRTSETLSKKLLFNHCKSSETLSQYLPITVEWKRLKEIFFECKRNYFTFN